MCVCVLDEIYADKAHQYTHNRAEYDHMAREWATKYADADSFKFEKEEIRAGFKLSSSHDSFFYVPDDLIELVVDFTYY